MKHDDGLLECDFGEWTGAAIADLAALPEWQTVQHSPSAFRFPDGESFPEMQARIVGAMEALCAAHAGGVVVCFSHADPIKAAVAHALGTPLDLFQRIVISPGSVSAISLRGGPGPRGADGEFDVGTAQRAEGAVSWGSRCPAGS